METKTHWKKIHNPDYIGAYTLMETGQPVDLVVKIKSVSQRDVKGEDGKAEQCMVAELYNQKPWVLNATNAKTLTKILGSPFIEDWAGRSITLFVAKIRAFGETVDALRVRPQLPVITLPELRPDHPKWNGAVEAMKAGNTTIEAIKKNYTLTPENEQLLCSNSKSDAAQ
jgi:hypothetical protein